jgi:hypothetical protein
LLRLNSRLLMLSSRLLLLLLLLCICLSTLGHVKEWVQPC